MVGSNHILPADTQPARRHVDSSKQQRLLRETGERRHQDGLTDLVNIEAETELLFKGTGGRARQARVLEVDQVQLFVGGDMSGPAVHHGFGTVGDDEDVVSRADGDGDH